VIREKRLIETHKNRNMKLGENVSATKVNKG
jgi:hypothetical protein